MEQILFQRPQDSKFHVFDIFLSVQILCNLEINQLNPSNTFNENYL